MPGWQMDIVSVSPEPAKTEECRLASLRTDAEHANGRVRRPAGNPAFFRKLAVRQRPGPATRRQPGAHRRPRRGLAGTRLFQGRPAAWGHRRPPSRAGLRSALGAGESGTLAGKAGRALAWSFASNALGRLGTVGIGVMLARLLGPHAFGTYAVASVALLAMLSFNDVAVSLAIVRWPDDPREIAPTVTTISVASSVAVYAGCYLGAPVYASSMGAPAAAGVIRVLALNVVLDGIVATPAALLQRHFRQDLKMIADQVNNWLGAIVSVTLAWLDFGPMSLALGRVSGAAAAGVLFVVFSPEPLRFGFSRARAGELIRYGTPLAGAAVVVFAVTNADQLVIGRLLGATALGFYALALNLASWPLTIFSRPVRSVAPAAFSRLQHDPPAMRGGFLSAVTLLGLTALPVCLAIAGTAVPLIGFVYGSRWLPAAQALAWLALLAAFRIFFELAYDYLVVLARNRAVFTVQVAWLTALVPALAGGALTGGIFGAAAAETAVAAVLVFPWYLFELNRVGIGPLAVAGRLSQPATGAALAGLAALAAARLMPGPAALAVAAVAGLLAMGLLAVRSRPALASLRGLRDAVPAGEAVPEPVTGPAGAPAVLGGARPPEVLVGGGGSLHALGAAEPPGVLADPGSLVVPGVTGTPGRLGGGGLLAAPGGAVTPGLPRQAGPVAHVNGTRPAGEPDRAGREAGGRPRPRPVLRRRRRGSRRRPRRG
jgi:O-antigen/teichoic acid export membrane protein